MPGRVLVVEDDAAIRLTIKAGLESEGYRVWAVADAQEAQTVLHYEGVQAAVLDWMLRSPIDGLALCRSIKSNPATEHVVVIMLTALSNPTRREQARAAGADVFLPKPYSLSSLLAALQSSLDEPRAEIETGLEVEVPALEPLPERRVYRVGVAAELRMPDHKLKNCDNEAVIHVTRGQGWILEILARYASVVPHEVLCRVAQQRRGGGPVRPGALRAMVWEINQKLREVGLPEIQVQRGVGYRWLAHADGLTDAADLPAEWEVREYQVGPAQFQMPFGQVMHRGTREVVQLRRVEGWVLEALAGQAGVVTHEELGAVLQQQSGQRMRRSSIRDLVRTINRKLRGVDLPEIQAQRGVGYRWLAHELDTGRGPGVSNAVEQ